MPRILHLVTQPEDDFSRALRWRHVESHDCQVTMVDLTVPNPDYDLLLDKLFESDSIQVW